MRPLGSDELRKVLDFCLHRSCCFVDKNPKVFFQHTCTKPTCHVAPLLPALAEGPAAQQGEPEMRQALGGVPQVIRAQRLQLRRNGRGAAACVGVQCVCGACVSKGPTGWGKEGGTLPGSSGLTWTLAPARLPSLLGNAWRHGPVP